MSKNAKSIDSQPLRSARRARLEGWQRSRLLPILRDGASRLLRIRSMSVAVAFAALLSLGAPTRGQEAYPSKTITMIIPFAAGGSTDVIGRLVAEGLRAVLGQAILIDNRGGA